MRLLEWGTLVDDVVVPFGASATGRVADLVLGAHVACLAGEQPASGGGRVVVAAAAPGRAALVAAATLALSAAGWEVQPLGDAIDPSTLSDAVDRGEAEVVVVVAAPSDGAAVHALVEPRRARLPAVVIAGPLAEPADERAQGPVPRRSHEPAGGHPARGLNRPRPPARDDAGMDGCPFCAIVAGEAPAHVVLDDAVALAFLDRRPLFPGHVLVVPRVHVETFVDLPADVVGPFFGADAARRGARWRWGWAPWGPSWP